MDLEDLIKFVNRYAEQQKNIMGYMKDKQNLILSSTVKIAEEFGELCDQVLSYNKRQRKDKMNRFNKDSLSEEFADVVVAILMLAHDMNIDIKDALNNKIKKLSEKYGI